MQASTVCTCADEREILDRILQAEAAIFEIQVQMGGMTKKESDTGAPFMMSGETLETFRTRVASYLSLVNDPLARSIGHASTDNACTPHFDSSAPPCLLEIVEVHEQVHVDACNKWKSFTNLASDRVGSMRALDYAQEEIRGYEAERDYALSLLRSLPACKPKGWFGVIYFKDEVEDLFEKDLGAAYERTGGRESSHHTYIQLAKILVRDSSQKGQQTAHARVVEGNSRRRTVTFETWCDAKRTRKASPSRTEEATWSVSGIRSAPPEFQFSFAEKHGDYHFSARMGGIVAEGSSERITSAQSGCTAKDNYTTKAPGSMSQTYAMPSTLGYVRGQGRVDPAAQSINGSSEQDTSASAELQHHTYTRWHFRRIL